MQNDLKNRTFRLFNAYLHKTVPYVTQNVPYVTQELKKYKGWSNSFCSVASRFRMTPLKIIIKYITVSGIE